MILNYKIKGEGPVLVLLHGMAGSFRYWDSYIEFLAQTNTVLAVDLLGFGHSPNSHSEYTYKSHIYAVQETLDSIRVTQPVTIIGHSMGALIGLKYAALYPKKISKLVLISMPIYVTALEAKNDVTKQKIRLKLAYYGITSHLLCTSWCYILRPISKKVAPLYLKSMPKQCAEDSVLHTWKSYSESLKNIIENQQVEKDLSSLVIPTYLIYGTKESPVVLHNSDSMKELGNNIHKIVLNGSHNLPLEQTDEIVQIILV